MLADSPLPMGIKASARHTFRVLADAEALVHGVTTAEVHFHEVGAVDSIIDTVGAWLALSQLNADEVVAGPIGLGYGHVNTQHGRLPLPAPATALLLQNHPVEPLDYRGETITPTGAALLTTMVDRWAPLPAGIIRSLGRGAGGRNPTSHPNVLSAFLVEHDTIDASTVDGSGELTVVPALVLATNLDDVTPEILAHTIGAVIDAGADDAWVVPVVMKKGRAAHELRVLCPEDRVQHLLTTIMAETGTLGVRVEAVSKHMARRTFDSVEVDGHRISMKIGPHGAKPEYEDVAAAAAALGLAARQVAQRAVVEYHRTSPLDHSI